MASVLVRDFLGELNTLLIFWTSGHFGIKGNQIAVELSRHASKTFFVELKSACRLSYETIKRAFITMLINQHCRRERAQRRSNSIT